MDRLKTPKGTRDYVGGDKILIERIIAKTEDVYKTRGGIPLDTPVFELKGTLTSKYGEDSKLIYDLAEQGGEECALRYDLTVPLARYLAQTKTVKIKRYQTGKVYRRDQPALNKGRYREFYQCDFDIVGEYEYMTADAEIVSAGCEIMRMFGEELGKGFEVRINTRGLVNAMMEACGVEESLRRTAGSSIDKLDKAPWEMVAAEMREKGVEEGTVGKLREYVGKKGPLSIISELKKTRLVEIESGREALGELERLYELLVLYGVDENVVVDLSLIRGLDYYTGVLIEGGFEGVEGSIVAGGRYDNLVRSLMETEEERAKRGGEEKLQIKCVGISLGVSRLYSLLEREKKTSYTEVMVCSTGEGLLEERVRVCACLRKEGIKAEYFMGATKNFQRQSEYAYAQGIGTVLLVGRKEIEENTCQIITGDSQNREKITVERSKLAETLRGILGSGGQR